MTTVQLLFVVCVFFCSTLFVNTGYINGGQSRTFRNQDNLGNYAFGYDIVDPYGATNYRKEYGDAYGNKWGSYGILDVDGRLRIVDYVADANGFRVKIRSNEPGMANKNSADVYYDVAEPAVSVAAVPVAPATPAVAVTSVTPAVPVAPTAPTVAVASATPIAPNIAPVPAVTAIAPAPAPVLSYGDPYNVRYDGLYGDFAHAVPSYKDPVFGKRVFGLRTTQPKSYQYFNQYFVPNYQGIR